MATIDPNFGTSTSASLATKSVIGGILDKYQSELLADWMSEQKKFGIRFDLIKENQLREESQEFLKLLTESVRREGGLDMSNANGAAVREFLGKLSRSRAIQGFSPTETATFVFSMKQPLFTWIAKEGLSPERQAQELWAVTAGLDKFGLYTMEVYQKSREEVIARQQQDLLELSTPVVQLWKGILALPMIGTLDSSRTQVVMETLLQRIVETGSEVAIIDITGVPTVDTLVAQHLLKTVTAARLMGAECIISGIRPQIAATIVHLGVDLGNIATKANMADAFRLALSKTNQAVGQAKAALAAPAKA